MSYLQKNLHKRPPPRPRFNSSMDCSPTEWKQYFTKQEDIKVGNNIFRVYLNGTSGPLLILLHGGGYSALTWALLTKNIVTRVECQVVAIDLRGHGSSITDDETNLALETLASDVQQVILAMYTDDPPSVIIGHSMGGAVAVEVAGLLNGVMGLCVIDVVEGTALESLSSMQSILRGRPAQFRTIEQAVLWCVKSGQTHNMEAARVSMPGQIKNSITGQLASEEFEAAKNAAADAISDDTEDAVKAAADDDHYPTAPAVNCIPEEEEEEDNLSVKAHCELPPTGLISTTDAQSSGTQNSCSSLFKSPSPVDSYQYIWRIDLSKTERFWSGWFNGLSQKFLDLRCPKILLLANIQGLDTALTVGQMQGKFQLQVLARSGHAIHEDQPDRVADVIAGFLVKQRLAASKDGFTPTLPGC